MPSELYQDSSGALFRGHLEESRALSSKELVILVLCGPGQGAFRFYPECEIENLDTGARRSVLHRTTLPRLVVAGCDVLVVVRIVPFLRRLRLVVVAGGICAIVVVVVLVPLRALRFVPTPSCPRMQGSSFLSPAQRPRSAANPLLAVPLRRTWGGGRRRHRRLGEKDEGEEQEEHREEMVCAGREARREDAGWREENRGRTIMNTLL